jgi:geranylgeranyl diphosphate synthase type II
MPAVSIKPLHDRIESRLRKALSKKNPPSLYGPMAYLFAAGGKRIRPLLLVLSCRAVGGKVPACLDAAAAVELLHTFTLVHDDIMDHDALRRGQPTVHAKWDEATAILAGDGLVTLAYQTLLKTRHPKLAEILAIFTDGLLTLCEGQALDKAFEQRTDVTLPEYMGMILKKTAALIEVSCEMGAILGNADVPQQRALKRFARKLGLAFQIQDDVLDIAADQAVLGKPTASDMMGKKKTYLTIDFLEKASPAQRALFTSMFGKTPLTPDETVQIRRLFKETGTLDSARRTAVGFIRQSVSALRPLPGSPSKTALETFALSIRDRLF